MRALKIYESPLRKCFAIVIVKTRCRASCNELIATHMRSAIASAHRPSTNIHKHAVDCILRHSARVDDQPHNMEDDGTDTGETCARGKRKEARALLSQGSTRTSARVAETGTTTQRGGGEQDMLQSKPAPSRVEDSTSYMGAKGRGKGGYADCTRATMAFWMVFDDCIAARERWGACGFTGPFEHGAFG